MAETIATLVLRYDEDIVAARQRARHIASVLGFDEQDKTRIATAVSEIVRVIQQGEGAAQAEFLLDGEAGRQRLLVKIRALARRSGWQDRSPTVSGITAAYHSAARLMDQCEMAPGDGEPVGMTLVKMLPQHVPALTEPAIQQVIRQIGEQVSPSPLEEVRQQNRELMSALDQLHDRQQELLNVNQELEETNRGVLALYAELDEKARQVKQADNMKSQFLFYMSHEFRTPLNSILGLTNMLLSRSEGDLTEEQDRQIRYIGQSGGDLLQMVDDLQDIAKIESGTIDIRPVDFEVRTLFRTLRGMLRPLVPSSSVTLVFDEPDGLPSLRTDEGKVSQILRNLISNALKFTECGEVRVRAEVAQGGQAVAFSVSDTGIGIAEEDQSRIFEEFTQIRHAIRRKMKGTGLGLPLCRKLASLLGGSVSLTSRPGFGSTFVATIPRLYTAAQPSVEAPQPAAAMKGGPYEERSVKKPSALIIDDQESDRYFLRKLLADLGWDAAEAFTGHEGLRRAVELRPELIVLDLCLPDLHGALVLEELGRHPETAEIPVMIVTSQTLSAEDRASLTRASHIINKRTLNRASWQHAIERAQSNSRRADDGGRED